MDEKELKDMVINDEVVDGSWDNIKVKIAVFCYNFLHKKSQDFLVRLFLEGIKIECVFAADPVELNIPPTSIRTKIRHIGLLHPKNIAERLGVEYLVAPHNSAEVIASIKDRELDLGIIAGARILKNPVIKSFSIGIINFHPGLIPEARGLDAMLWSIYKDLPLGVTAHLIDENIDAGNILLKEKISIYPDDTLLDFSERLYDKQIDMIKPAIKAALLGDSVPVDLTTPYHRKMPVELEKTIPNKLPDYLGKQIEESRNNGPYL